MLAKDFFIKKTF